MTQKWYTALLVVSSSLILSGCLGGGADGGFADLIGGNLSDVDELTIVSSTPSGNTVTVDVGDQQAFTILAQTPPPGSVSYYFTVNGTNVSNTNAYTLTGANSTALPGDVGVGNHTVTAVATDGTASKSRSWTVKVNGPPVLTNAYSTAPKVAIGSTLNLTVSGTDPNGDTITYTWQVSGATSAHLVGTNNTAVLTADSSLLTSGLAGPVTITVTGEDDSGATGSTTFQVEINAFDQSCNELAQYEMCTYAGNPTLGDGMDPDDPAESSYIKLSPIAISTDDRNDNLIIADYVNNLVWYWNRTASAVDFLQFSGASAISANTIKVIAGTGAAATESGDTSLNVGVNGPRGLYYDSSRNRLFISEWGASRVKVVESNGVTAYILGVGAGNVDGALATAHVCTNPAGMSFYNNKLYVACYNSHNIKEWNINVANISTSTVNVIYGATSGTSANFRNDRSAMEFAGASYAASTEDGAAYAICAANCGVPNPYDVHVDATGLYVTHPAHHYVRYCNFNGSSSRTFLGVTVGVNFCRSILGTGAAGYGASGDPRTAAFQAPYGITVDSGKILVSGLQNDRIVLINVTGSNLPIGDYGVAINNNNFDLITGSAGGYSEGTPASTRQVNDPYDIIVEPDDTTYPRSYLIADYSNRRLRRFNYSTGSTSTLAGSGRLRDDNIGSTGLANAFYFNTPTGIVYDSQTSERAFYVVDSNNDRIIKIDRYGNITSPFGGSTNAPGSVNGSQSPTSVIFNSDATIFTGLALFNDFSLAINNAIYSHLQVWNRSGTTKAYLNATSTGNNKVNQLGGNFNLADNTTSTNYDDDANAMLVSLYNPAGVAISENQLTTDREVFISDQNRHCIRRIKENGSMDTVIGVCKNGSQPDNIIPTQAQGGGGTSADSVGSLLTEFLYRPVGLHIHYPTSADATAGGGTPASLNGNGNLIIADYNYNAANLYGNRVRYWNRSGTSVQFAGVSIPDGTVQTIACNAGTTNTSENIFATGAQCNNPVSFAMNDDYLCFTQAGKHNVRCLYLTGANEGRIFTVAGSLQALTTGLQGVPYNYNLEGLAATSQKLNGPTGLTFDSNGDLFIVDTSNHIIKKVKMTP